jgi:cell wall-associated NlpC family hydrolase
VDFRQFKLPISKQEALDILCRKGFQVVPVDVVDLARKCIGQSLYRRSARFYQAPFVVDCSTLSKWLYSKAGIWLPRHSIDQRKMGSVISAEERKAGDLVFIQGAIPYWHEDPSDGVGHVGMCTKEGTVIHAANSKRGVVEDEFDLFVGSVDSFRGIRRIGVAEVITLESPNNRIVEWSGEIQNIILQNL